MLFYHLRTTPREKLEMLTTVLFLQHPILDKGEGRKLSNLTKWFGEKAGEGEEKTGTLIFG